MRRLLLSLLAMSILSVIGCRATGVSDCGCDCGCENSCDHSASSASESIPQGEIPMPLPEIKEALPNTPKKL